MFGLRQRKHLERGFCELVQEYGPSLHLFASRITGDEKAAEIIIGEVFLRLWQTRAAWALAGDMETWLYRLTEKRVIVHLRKKSSFKTHERALQPASFKNECPNAAEAASADLNRETVRSETETSLQGRLAETYASIRDYSATHVSSTGRLVQMIQPGVLPHFLPQRRLRRDLQLAALIAATAVMLGLAAWVA